MSNDPHQLPLTFAPPTSSSGYSGAEDQSQPDQLPDEMSIKGLAPVDVIRSARRKKSSQARLINGRLEVRIPAWFNHQQEMDTVDFFSKKFAKRSATTAIDLDKRVAVLIARYGFRQPVSIRWVSNQVHRWGSCTPAHGSIRISDRLANYPVWVLDYVLCHELAHLTHSNHGREFWELVENYPLTERARGFLMAKGLSEA